LEVGRGTQTPHHKKFLVTKPHIKERICEVAKALQELQSHGGGGGGGGGLSFPYI
jgi:hypothetical protein